jgi:GT2 family glycosyltransferase
LDIVIVNWNSGAHLQTCIDSLEGQYSIIVVDNASTDASQEFIANRVGVSLLQLDHNLGFSKACNLGAQQAQSEFILFLNPDAAVFPSTIETVIAYMQNPANADVGICGVQLFDERGFVAHSCSRFPKPWSLAAQSFGFHRLFPCFGQFMIEWAHDFTRDVDQVIGAFFMVRRHLFDTLKGFDERFFVYYEEVDFSYRARQAGWRSVYLVDAQAFHAGGGTSNQVKALRLFYSIRSRLLYAQKHFSVASTLLIILTTMLVEPLSRVAFAASRRSWSSCKETLQAYLMLYFWLPKAWLK